MKALTLCPSPNDSSSDLLDQRTRALCAFFLLGCASIALSSLLLHFGLAVELSELLPALEGTASSVILVDLAAAALLLSSVLFYQHYLLLLSFVKRLRVAFRRFLRSLQPPTPALCSAPRSAHGSRAPPFLA